MPGIYLCLLENGHTLVHIRCLCAILHLSKNISYKQVHQISR